MVRLRELEADGDEILAVGEELLVTEKAARDALGNEIEPGASPEEVADAVKDDHAATFGEALEEYRAAMARARAFVVDHNLATPPDEDHLNIIETPSFIRHLIPFAAYYHPAKFDPTPVGTYIVTPPSSPEMMREHNRSSIGNTSVHEAYPGHHLQLSAAITNPSLVRLFSGAPEFAEGWAFYCERMMKEAGFEDTPEGLVHGPHRCDLARHEDHPRRPAPPWAHRLRRGGRPARGRDRVRAPGRAGGGEAIHLHADVPAVATSSGAT